MCLATDWLKATWRRSNPCLALGVSGLFLLALQPSLTSAQEVDVRNTEFREEGTRIVVSYDLIGERGEEYEVTLLLSTSGGRAFDYNPKATTGDIGEDVRPGLEKQITWNVLEDYPNGLQSQNVQFKVTAKEEGGNGWLYAIGSAVLVGGGGTAAAFLLGLVGGEDSGSEGNGPAPIPAPDGPPQ